jgi:hypothetical protein
MYIVNRNLDRAVIFESDPLCNGTGDTVGQRISSFENARLVNDKCAKIDPEPWRVSALAVLNVAA